MLDNDPLVEHVRDFIESHEPGSYKFEAVGGDPYDLVVYAEVIKEGRPHHACGLVDSTLLADMFLFDEYLVLVDRSQNTALRPSSPAACPTTSPTDYDDDSNSKRTVIYPPEDTN